MAIKPSSDIVLEVLKAADPLRVEAATQRLVALGAGGVDAADDFTKVLDAADQPPAAPAIAPNAADMRDRLAHIGVDSVSIRSPCTMAGMVPSGLMRRYSGSCWSNFSRSR